ncbi:MAG: aldo/keto reductase [Spirochaetia bacterium]|jgi:aryl-alcohol dehydrogenase-like predicted oxidoreductase|nr:aldo/keto reductase [Spirochaetia bacterium]
MKYRILGKSGLKVSVISLGTYQYGGSWGREYTQKDVDSIFAAAEDAGINFLDTAECYGVDNHAERLIGNAIAGKRDKWLVATKFGHERKEPQKNSPAWEVSQIKNQLETSLKLLKTDYIDLYQFHSGPDEIFDNDEIWTMLDKEKAKGKIRHLGISLNRTKSDNEDYQTLNALKVGAQVIQLKYNRLERDAEKKILPAAEKLGLGVIVRVALASGMLSGKYQNIDEFSSQESRAKKYKPELIKKLQREIEDIIKNELPENVLLSQYALAWALSHPAVSCVIAGCKSAEQVRINAATADLDMMGKKHKFDI